MESEEASASLSTADLTGAGGSESSFRNDFVAANGTEDNEDMMEDVEVGGGVGAVSKEPVMTEVVGGTLVDVPGTMNKGVRAGAIRRWVYVTAAVLILLAVIIGVAASSSNKKNSSSSSTTLEGSSPNGSPVVSPVSAPVMGSPVSAPTTNTEPRKADYEQVVQFLITRGVSNETDLRTRNTPQHNAAVFVANHDPLNLPLPQSSSLSDPEVEKYVTRYIMTLLHHALDGYNWPTQLNFMSDIETCYWNGVKASYSPGFILGLEGGGFFCRNDTMLPLALDLGEYSASTCLRVGLPVHTTCTLTHCSVSVSYLLTTEYNQLNGKVPTELGLLTSLLFLDLEFNNITGTIPTELCRLTSLEHLSLRGNLFTGTLPSCMGQWTNLVYFDVELNQLQGSLPQGNALCNMTQLETLNVHENMLTGSIPTCIGQWSSLSGFFASENFLKGEIPSEIRSLPNLTLFLVDNNELTGDPTALFNNIASLEFVYLDNNRFTGVLDSTFAANMSSLLMMDLSSNNFTLDPTTPVFPLHLLQHPTLQVLDVSVNRLEGSLPSELQANEALVFFSVHTNSLKGTIPRQLHQFSKLIHLDMSKNNLSGSLPNHLFSMKLHNLFLSDNPTLEPGALPDSILTNHTGFREISLRNTRRTGSLPAFTGFSELQLLDLGSNSFSGEIPSQYSTLPELRYLLLNNNPNLTGSIPDMGQSSLLQIALLDDTDVSGDFSSICALTAFTLIDATDPPGDSALVVNCNTTTGEVTNCVCCQCCPVAGGCSAPVVASLDWTWEFQLSRTVRNFAVNETLLQDL